MFYNLAVDIEGRIYAWGNNDIHQCGLSIKSFSTLVKEPTMIQDLKDYEIDAVVLEQPAVNISLLIVMKRVSVLGRNVQ